MACDGIAGGIGGAKSTGFVNTNWADFNKNKDIAGGIGGAKPTDFVNTNSIGNSLAPVKKNEDEIAYDPNAGKTEGGFYSRHSDAFVKATEKQPGGVFS